ncbi:MAG TPA: hypothetical protein VGE04_05560 [Chloroflexia bacterium]|jgi:hypothetical protein
MLASRSYNRAYDLAVNGDPVWAHWIYEQGEWERFLALDARRIRLSRARWLSFTIVLSVAAGLFASSAVWSAGIGFWAGLVAGFLGAALGFVWLTGSGSVWFFRSKDKWYEGLKAQKREIVVTSIAIVIAGTVMPLMGDGASLNRAWIAYADPPQNTAPILKFQLEELGSRRGPYEVWVPLPKDKESEGRELAERFQREIVRPARRTSR